MLFQAVARKSGSSKFSQHPVYPRNPAERRQAQLIQESVAKSLQGSANLEEVANAVAGVTERSGYVKRLIDEVSASCHEQALASARSLPRSSKWNR